METVGDQVDVLLDLQIVADALEGRHLKLAKSLVIMVFLATFFNVAALLWSQSNIAKVKETQEGIERTSIDLQDQEARTARLLCLELNDIKTPIRQVLSQSKSSKGYQVLFQNTNCNNLPNATPVKP